jgi:hypothetical protein
VATAHRELASGGGGHGTTGGNGDRVACDAALDAAAHDGAGRSHDRDRSRRRGRVARDDRVTRDRAAHAARRPARADLRRAANRGRGQSDHTSHLFRPCWACFRGIEARAPRDEPSATRGDRLRLSGRVSFLEKLKIG